MRRRRALNPRSPVVSGERRQDRFSGAVGAVLAVLCFGVAAYLALMAMFSAYGGYGSDARRVLVYAALALVVAVGLAIHAARQLLPRRAPPPDA